MPGDSLYFTRSRRRGQAGRKPDRKHADDESDDELTVSRPPARGRGHIRGHAQRGQGLQGRGRKSVSGPRRDSRSSALYNEIANKPFCTVECIRSLIAGDRMDLRCPNAYQHGFDTHPFGPEEFINRLHAQLLQDRELSFCIQYIRGRTGSIVRATLLSHGYTVIIKAAAIDQQPYLLVETENYRRLYDIQGKHIPVYIGDFGPRINYWYQGELMTHMMILSWAGRSVRYRLNADNTAFFLSERKGLRRALRSHGVDHRDSEWRNVLWDERCQRTSMIDLEQVVRLRERLGTSGLARYPVERLNK